MIPQRRIGCPSLLAELLIETKEGILGLAGSLMGDDPERAGQEGCTLRFGEFTQNPDGGLVIARSELAVGAGFR